jgi:hypothetical protein
VKVLRLKNAYVIYEWLHRKMYRVVTIIICLSRRSPVKTENRQKNCRKVCTVIQNQLFQPEIKTFNPTLHGYGPFYFVSTFWITRSRLLTCYYSMEGAHDPGELCKYGYNCQAKGEWASWHTSNPNP